MTTRVAIVGAGNMGARWLRVCRANLRCEVVAIVDPAGGEGATHASVRDVGSVDLAIVATPTDTHRKVADDALSLARVVLVEKPMAHSVAASLDLLSAAALHCSRLFVGHVERFNPAFVALRKLLASGDIGPISSVDTTRVGPNIPAWASVDAHVVQDLAVHDFDLLRLLLGPLTVRWCQPIYGERLGIIEARIQMASKLGALAETHVSWRAETKRRTIRAYCGRATVHADLIKQTMQTTWHNGDIDGEGTDLEPLALQLDALLNVCDGGDAGDLCSAEDGLAAVRLVEQAAPRAEWA